MCTFHVIILCSTNTQIHRHYLHFSHSILISFYMYVYICKQMLNYFHQFEELHVHNFDKPSTNVYFDQTMICTIHSNRSFLCIRSYQHISVWFSFYMYAICASKFSIQPTIDVFLWCSNLFYAKIICRPLLYYRANVMSLCFWMDHTF